MPYYLGIDGGGSKTTCAVGDDATTLATATAGASNVVRVGEGQARESLHKAVRQACAAARITPAQVAHACIGAAGAARPEIAGIVRRILAEVLPNAIDVGTDMHIAMEAAFGAGPGVIVNAGTGSFAYGRSQQGTIVRTGGWGFAISDEGSAHWIGRAAVSAVLRVTDEQGTRGQTVSQNSPPLLRGLLKTWDVNSPEDLASTANSMPPPDFAALFPAVLAAADAGDDLSKKVLTQAGVELARIADIAICQLFPETAPPSPTGRAPSTAADTPVPLAMTGGVFRHASLVREVFYNEIRKSRPQATLSLQVIEPVEGALRLARSAASKAIGARK